MEPIDELVGRRLTLNDIPQAVALSEEAGWNQTAHDWQVMLEQGKGYGYATPEKQLVATALTLPHGNQIAWISMVLVTKAYQKRGLATQLLQTCIDSLLHVKKVPILDATEDGRPIYEKLGFHGLYRLHRMARTPILTQQKASSNLTEITLAPITPSEFTKIIEFDSEFFGADRSKILRHLLERQPSRAFLANQQGKIQGFVMGREGRQALQIGPVVSKEEKVAIALVNEVLKGVEGSVIIDALEHHERFRSWVQSQGFVRQRSFTRMMLGSISKFDEPGFIYAMAGPELG